MTNCSWQKEAIKSTMLLDFAFAIGLCESAKSFEKPGFWCVLFAVRGFIFKFASGNGGDGYAHTANAVPVLT